ncbi:MAG: hypothetical protein ACFFAN_11385 [Promethearchaeota archaeon]
MEFNFLEKLSLTLVTDLAFYILIAYIGYFIGFSITAIFFFIMLSICFFSLIFYIIIREYRNGKWYFLKPKKDTTDRQEFFRTFSLLKYIKNSVHLNGVLIVIFLILTCIFNVVRFTYFYGTDPWLHIFIIKKITTMNYLPLEEYYGSVGLHIFGAVIHFFSGIDFILIPKYFVFYTFLVSSLIFYNLLMRIFKNRNLAFLGVFILNSASLGFTYMMFQFWPSSLVIIQCLLILFLLYTRLQKFINIKRPTTKLVFKDIIFYYILITIIFISAILTHALTSIILLISFLWIYLIYFLRDYKRGFDFLLLSGLLGIFFLFYYFGLSSEHFWFIKLTDFSIIFIILTFSGILGGGGALVWLLQKRIVFTKGGFKAAIEGKKPSYYKKIEDKKIISFSLSIIIFIIVIYSIGNFLLFNLPITTIFVGIQVAVFITLMIWGGILFHKKPKGKPFLLWGIFFFLFFIGVFLFDVLTVNSMLWVRIFYLTPPLLVIGFISYVYKLIRTNDINNFKKKIFLSFIIIFSSCSTYIHEFLTIQYASLTKREVRAVEWYSEHTSEKNVIVSKFGYNYIFMYYDYPYNKKDENLKGDDTHYFVKRDADLFPPDNHIDEDGNNRLQELKKERDADVIIAIDDHYYLAEDWQTYGELSEEEMEEYYELGYLNKIYSCKDENGETTTYYWVI